MLPAMCGKATLATEVSRTSMNVASMTEMAMTQGLCRGCHWTAGIGTLSGMGSVAGLSFGGLLVSRFRSPAKAEERGQHPDGNSSEGQQPNRDPSAFYLHRRDYRHAGTQDLAGVQGLVEK